MLENLSQSQEDYLEAIYKIAEDKGVARVRDIAHEQNVSMPSASGAMKRLAKMDLIKHGRYEYVELTEEGRKYAEKVVGRHAALKSFFADVLGVDEKTADKDACAVEHQLSEKTVKKLFEFLKGRVT